LCSAEGGQVCALVTTTPPVLRRWLGSAGFVGRTVQQFKAVLDANGIVSTSGHVLIPQPFDPAAWSASLADAATLGSRYIRQNKGRVLQYHVKDMNQAGTSPIPARACSTSHGSSATPTRPA
jgi:hypothetical protein